MPLAQLFLIFYAIFALTTPIFVVYLFVRHSDLKSKIEALSESLRKQSSDHERQIRNLISRIHELELAVPQRASASQPVEGKPEAKPAVPAAQPSHDTQAAPQPTPLVPPPPLSIPALHAKDTTPPVGAAAPPPPPPVQPPVAKESQHPSTVTPPTVPPAQPSQPRPLAPSPKETAPATPPQVHVPAPLHPSAPREQTAARSSIHSSREPLRYAEPKPSFAQQIKKVSALEETLGTNWLNKLGIIILVLGVALFGIYEFSTVGAAGKAAISFFASIALLAGGILFEKRDAYRVLGRTFIGGGWALFFFSTYAIYHVASMHLLNSLTLDCILMLSVAVAMGTHTLRYRSQLVTGLAFLLGYTTVALSHDTVYSLSAGVILAIGLVLIVLKMRWFELEVFGILSSYLNHLYWLYRLLGSDGAHGRPFPEYHASLAMLFFYWLTFRISYIVRDVKSDTEEAISTAAALLNTIFLLGVMKFQSVQPQLAYVAPLGIGLLEFSFGQLPVTKRRRPAFVLLSVMGAALMLAAPPFHFASNNVAVLWLLAAELFLFAGLLVKEVVFRRIGLLTGVLVGLHLAILDFEPVMKLRSATDDALIPAGVLFGLSAVVLYGNSLTGTTRWKNFFPAEFDLHLLQLHSYIAAASAVVAAWALAAQDWTAVAFAGIMLALTLLAREFPPQDLQVQYTAIAFLTFARALAVNLHFAAPSNTHVISRLVTLPILGAVYYLTARLSPLRDAPEQQRALRGIFATMASALFALLIWFEVSALWQPLAFIAFALLLSEAARSLRYPLLAWHTHALGVLALFTAVTADAPGHPQWRSLPVHCLGAIPVLAGFYWVALRPGSQHEAHRSLSRALYTWAAACLTLWALWGLLEAPWIPVGWIAFAVAFALVARRFRYSQLFWQANAVAVLAGVRAFVFNYTVDQKLGWSLDVRTVTIAFVAAGLYFLSRKAAPDEDSQTAIAYLHSFAATALLAYLGWYEAPNGWLAPLWVGFALVLAIIDRRFELDELRWQAHILSLLALVRCFLYNLHLTATWHNLSVRLLSLTLVAISFYALSRIVRMPEEWRDRDVHHAYSWAASTLVSLLLWYELVPLNIALGWAVFGLVLFEYGILRGVRQFRYQAYVALFASFVRIFFANLTLGEPGHFWNLRAYTILPLVPIYFFVYAQSSAEPSMESASHERTFSVSALLATLGTATIVALFYFQFSIEWVVVSWAAVVLTLFAAAFLLDRDIFLYQGLLLTLLVFSRGMAHNLFGAGYFAGGDWKGRFFILGTAITLLLASLVFAFPLRERYRTRRNSHAALGFLSKLAARPEQPQFFVPIVLLSLMLALKMRSGMVTVSWGIEGVFIILLALALKERSFRLTGLSLLLLCVGKVLVMDVWGLQARDRYLTFIIVGAALLFVSYLYSRYREAIRQLL
jgi:hypothetical protein